VALSAFSGEDLANPTGHLQELWPVSSKLTWCHCAFFLSSAYQVFFVILAGKIPQILEAGAFLVFPSFSLACPDETGLTGAPH